MSIIKEILIYKTSSNKSPFLYWLNKLDPKTRAIVRTRIERVRLGNLGDTKLIKNGNGIFELRIDFGSGYRIYFGKYNNSIIILLLGGDKKSQTRDIEKAKNQWLDCKDKYE